MHKTYFVYLSMSKFNNSRYFCEIKENNIIDTTAAVEYCKHYDNYKKALVDAKKIKAIDYEAYPNVCEYEGPKAYKGQDFLKSWPVNFVGPEYRWHKEFRYSYNTGHSTHYNVLLDVLVDENSKVVTQGHYPAD